MQGRRKSNLHFWVNHRIEVVRKQKVKEGKMSRRGKGGAKRHRKVLHEASDHASV
ncbi:hypothetical protein SLEP1_g17213 [Rubroshorea leprosula]|uniref:Uncharacterized protein n=1 Tax=Rubroshorea leprosula TaxID=152421 RepID=A0AAV5J414_9ROSI|nr:hypothetical protein SLEP1_g17213 [Rubroshorea leprosula]